jgi:hypothetical protein
MGETRFLQAPLAPSDGGEAPSRGRIGGGGEAG